MVRVLQAVSIPKGLAALLLGVMAAVVGGAILAGTSGQSPSGAAISGELMQWHRVTLTFDGPMTSETADPNPFWDYRLNVTFSNGDTELVVPGFYAADGDAGNTGATEGNKWRVHFMPPATGKWTYTASFRTGDRVAISLDPNAGSPTDFDGLTGSFNIAPSDKSGTDLRGHGLLAYVGGHYMQFAGSGEYWLKGGADSPENFLGYDEFDGTYDQGGIISNFLHRYEPHAGDWQPGDPTWADERGKNIIGAVNYLASQGVNSIYFLTYNLDGGDGRDTWPWIEHQSRERFDVSKLDQWEVVFSHMTANGIQLHVVTQEAENDHALGADLTDIRMLYYRELVARFSHHPALQWNLGEENDNSNAAIESFSTYIRAQDPYDHPLTVHTFKNMATRFGSSTRPGSEYYDTTLAEIPAAIDATSIQGRGSDYNRWAQDLRQRSTAAGHPWVIYGDEQVPEVRADMSNVDQLRREALWGNLMGGGGGVEWYFGYQGDFGDMQSEDFRPAEPLWQDTRHALDFFHAYLPFWEMTPDNDLLLGADGYALAQPGQLYAAFLQNGAGGDVRLDLGSTNGQTYNVFWYNPRTGGDLLVGDTAQVSGTGYQPIGDPPMEANQDWAVLLMADNPQPPAAPTLLTGTAISTSRIQLNWIDNANNESRYEIWRGASGAGFNLLTTVAANRGTFTDTGLEATTEYCYRVRAVNAAGASDYSNEMCLTTLDASANQPPFFQPTSDQTVGAGERIDITVTAEDPDDDPITLAMDGPAFTYLADMGNGSGIIGGQAPDTTEVYPLTVTASDGMAQTQANFNLEVVTGSADDPVVVRLVLVDAASSTDIVELTDGMTVALDQLPSDRLNVRAETVPAQVGSVRFALNGNGNYRTEGVAPYAMAGDRDGVYMEWDYTLGTQAITATPYSGANAGGNMGTPLSVTFTIAQTGGDAPINLPPTLPPPGDQSTDAGQPVNLALGVSDPNGDTVTCSVSGLPAGLALDPATCRIAGTAANVCTGGTLQSSGSGAILEQNGLVTIDVEYAPVVPSWSVQSSVPGAINGTYYEWKSGDNSQRVDPAGSGTMTYQIQISTPGIYRFQMRSAAPQVTEHNDMWLRFTDADEVFAIKYRFPSNTSPSQNGYYPVGVNNWFKVYQNNSGDNWTWMTRTKDEDAHWIYASFDAPGIYTMQVSGRSTKLKLDRFVLWQASVGESTATDPNNPASPLATQDGEICRYDVTVTALDNGNPQASSSTRFAWMVALSDEVIDVNTPPVIDAVPAQQVAAGEMLGVPIRATDADGDPITLSFNGNISSLPADWAALTDNGDGTGLLTVNPPADAAAQGYSASISASDGEITVSTSVSVSVTQSASQNNPPTLAAPADQTGTEGAVASLALQASDPDGDLLRYDATNLPPGLSIDAATGLISGQIAAGAAAGSPYLVTVTVSDTTDGRAQASFNWTVQPANVDPGLPAVTQFVLVNADTDQDIVVMTPQMSINLALLPTTNLNIRAETSPASVGSVAFDLNAETPFNVENEAPYTLNGNQDADYEPWVPAVGGYTLTATPYTGQDASGQAGTPLTLTFDVINEAPTPTPPPPADGLAVTQFVLVNADTDQDIVVMVPGMTIDLNQMPTRNLNIRAEATPSVRSVAFSWNTNIHYRYENDAPYALARDRDSDYFAWTPPVGTHVLAATPYAEADKGGAQGTPLSLSFTVIEGTGAPPPVPTEPVQPPPVQGLAVTQFVLVNADTDQDILVMTPGMTIDLNQMPTRNLNIRAQTNPAVVGSVNFGWNGSANYRYENDAPYALARDRNSDYFAWTPPNGTHTLTATPFALADKGGVAGAALSITFTVVGG